MDEQDAKLRVEQLREELLYHNRRYYILDDPGHVNPLSAAGLERDLKGIFPVVDIRPTYVLFENRFGFIKRNRDRLRLICDKVFGYCEKL